MALTDLTLQQLWQLFPIILEPHNPEWSEWYRDARHELLKTIPAKSLKAIHHIGSTSVPDIWAKPIVDILVELTPDADIEAVASAVEQTGWLRMSTSTSRISLNKGYTENGFAPRVYHLHLRFQGDNDEVAFAENLRQNPSIAREYEQLKLSLWHRFEHDRDAYTAAKTDFILLHTPKTTQI